MRQSQHKKKTTWYYRYYFNDCFAYLGGFYSAAMGVLSWFMTRFYTSYSQDLSMIKRIYRQEMVRRRFIQV